MFCPYCGKEIKSGDLFCGNCGSSLNTVYGHSMTSFNKALGGIRVGNSTISNIATGSLKLFNLTLSSKVVISTIVTAIVIAGMILYNVFFVVHPSDIVSKFINAINDCDYNALVDCLDPKIEKFYNAAGNIVGGLTGVRIQDVMDLFPALVSYTNSNGQFEVFQFKDSEILSEEISGDMAYVRVKTTITGGDSDIKSGVHYLIFVLRKYTEGWRVVDIKEVGLGEP